MKKNNNSVPEEYLPVFCRELHSLVRSGVPIAEGLQILLEDEEDPTVLPWLTELHSYAETGEPLGDSIRKTGAFPDYMTDMIFLAEMTGKLEDTLLSLSRYYDRKTRMKNDIKSAVTVPVVLLVVMIGVVVLLITEVLPVFQNVFNQLGASMGTVATGLMRAGGAIGKIGAALAVIVAVIAVCGLVIWLVPSLREKFSKWFTARFGGKGILGQMAVSRFASGMAMAASSGMSMEDSVTFAAKICGGAKEIDAKTEKCRADIEEGKSPAEALCDCGLFSNRDCRLLKLSERTGSMYDALEDVAARQEEQSLRSIDKLVGAVEPTVVVVTAALAGVIIISVMLPLLGLLSTVG